MVVCRLVAFQNQHAKSLGSFNHSLASRVSLWIVFISLANLGVTRPAEELNPIVDRMSKVDLFAFGGVGFASVISQGETDCRLILSRPFAEANFEKLFAAGNPQAKCYALVGIRKLNPERFKALSSSLRSSKTKVSTMRGCMMSHETIAALIQRIQAGEYSI
jgi:hypothetical protein